MYDKMIKSGNSQLQHGSNNDRIYLMDLAEEDMPEILNDLDHMAETYNYTKIFAKVPEASSLPFLEKGYVTEAAIPGFFSGDQDCLLMGKFRDKKRSKPVDQRLNEHVVATAISKRAEAYKLPSGFSFKKAGPEDVYKMAELYGKVFDSYPFPILDPAYIRETMNQHIVYFAIWVGEEIVALSACEIYTKDKSVEMTDFAILPEYRGNHLSLILLNKMEKEMRNNEIKTAYTIARSCSYGMNSTFAKGGYKFSGVLVQNTQIGGNIEDMNVWYKSLS